MSPRPSIIDLLAHNHPAVAVEVLELLGGHVLLEVDAQHTLEILFGGSAGGEAVVVDVLFDTGQVRKNVSILIPPQADDDINSRLDAIST